MRSQATAMDAAPRQSGTCTRTCSGRPRGGRAMGPWVLALAFVIPATVAMAAGPSLQPQELDPALPANPSASTLLHVEAPTRSGLLAGLETSLTRTAQGRRVAPLDCRSAMELPVALGLETTLSGLTAAEHRATARMMRGEQATWAHQAQRCHTLCTLVSTATPASAETARRPERGRSCC